MNIEHLIEKIQLLTWEERADRRIAPQNLPPKKFKITDLKTNENFDWIKQLKYNPIEKLMDTNNALIKYKILNNYYRLLPTSKIYQTALFNLRNDFHRVGNLKNLDELNKIIDEKPNNAMSVYDFITLIKTLSELYDYYCHNRMTTIQKSFYFILKQQQENGSFDLPFFLNVYTIEILMKYNYEKNRYAEKSIRWLIREQNSDGGWGNADGKSDIWITLKVLNACSYHSKMKNRKRIFKGVDFILNNYLKSNSGGIIEGKNIWHEFPNKHFNKDAFRGGIIKILEVCNRLGYSKENKQLKVFLDILKKNQHENKWWYDNEIDNEYQRELITSKVLEIFYNYYSQQNKTVKKYKIKSGGRTSAKTPIFLTDEYKNNLKESLSEEEE
ncbi:MAG: prenyltransferase/squalene oxidase repeat-containing protein [Candidatus Marinimicrobia bacterium]|nr:prenyltransferase/squalene oxidase repeat-containing protein [Candidatus Neomarinimicrobiota bacterium]